MLTIFGVVLEKLTLLNRDQIMMPLSTAEYEKELAIMKKDQKQGKDFMCMRLSELCNAWDVPQNHKHNGAILISPHTLKHMLV